MPYKKLPARCRRSCGKRTQIRIRKKEKRHRGAALQRLLRNHKLITGILLRMDATADKRCLCYIVNRLEIVWSFKITEGGFSYPPGKTRAPLKRKSIETIITSSGRLDSPRQRRSAARCR